MTGRRQLWRSFWFAVRRSGKDARARKVVLGAALLGALVAGYAAWFFVVFPRGAREWPLGFYAVLFSAAWGLRAVFKKREEAPLSILPQSAPPPPADSEGVRQCLEERLAIAAALMVRAVSEQWLRQNPLPEGAEVVARQFHNRVLRERGLWEKLPAAERDLLIVADGEWTDEQVSRTVEWSEEVRLLRWVLRLDAEIEPLAHFRVLDADQAIDALERESVPHTPMPGAWDMRAEREAALAYAARAFAELMARGLAGDNAEAAAWAAEMRTECLGESRDFVVGARTVADLDDDELRLLYAVATAREQHAARLVEVLSAGLQAMQLKTKQI